MIEIKFKKYMQSFFDKNKYWILTNIPALLILFVALSNRLQVKSMHQYSGYFAVGFLVLVLILKPLRIVYPNFFLVKWGLGKHKREIGVASFTYALIHAYLYYVKKGSIAKIIPYLVHPVIISGLFVAFPILFALAITSNNYSVKRLGYVNWKKLHKKVYIAQYAVLLHMILVKEIFWAIALFAPLFYMQKMKKRKESLKANQSNE